ncbi:hypothetical protein FHX42_004542 [Saccharopolyspora lacisalsi]|uniref:Uncharacterized protein n=1 Tax=Halosaccharopolyspora lacisalsi TaxID=1000566 RepID=A0A839E8H2_9PSEU|nr:hypothetical protein [Halosaccharopolyspora lacisalsi]MBA8827158.1 hypothetical protein [Halosaccharopolyspora lacisalsi]
MTGTQRPGWMDVFGRPAPSAGPEPPQQVLLARWAWIAGLVVWLVRSVIQLTDRRMLVDQLRRMAPELTQSEVDAAANSATLFSLLLALSIGAVGLMLVRRMLWGRNWARILITVVTAFSVVSTALALVGIATLGPAVPVRVDVVNILLSVVVAGISVAVLVLLWHPASNRYFRAAAVARGGRSVVT